jgi:hypothetical protein
LEPALAYEGREGRILGPYCLQTIAALYDALVFLSQKEAAFLSDNGQNAENGNLRKSHLPAPLIVEKNQYIRLPET